MNVEHYLLPFQTKNTLYWLFFVDVSFGEEKKDENTANAALRDIYGII